MWGCRTLCRRGCDYKTITNCSYLVGGCSSWSRFSGQGQGIIDVGICRRGSFLVLPIDHSHQHGKHYQPSYLPHYAIFYQVRHAVAAFEPLRLEQTNKPPNQFEKWLLRQVSIDHERSIFLFTSLLELHDSSLGFNVCKGVLIDIVLHHLLFLGFLILVLLVDQWVLNVRYRDAVFLEEPLLKFLQQACLQRSQGLINFDQIAPH